MHKTRAHTNMAHDKWLDREGNRQKQWGRRFTAQCARNIKREWWCHKGNIRARKATGAELNSGRIMWARACQYHQFWSRDSKMHPWEARCQGRGIASFLSPLFTFSFKHHCLRGASQTDLLLAALCLWLTTTALHEEFPFRFTLKMILLLHIFSLKQSLN